MVDTGIHQLPAIGQFGRFEVLGRLAWGGMAEILLARQRAAGGASRLVVIKKILKQVAENEAFVEMFLHEARIALGFNHPNICAVHEFGQQDDTYFIAMEWVNGVSLKQIFDRARERSERIPIEVAVRIIAEAASALHYAHRAKAEDGSPLNLVHRDVTPDNIMVSFDGAVKLLDFGIAKAATQTTKTQAGELKGKFPYMAPEQYTGLEVDGRADLFSLGVSLFEVLTGQTLYHRATDYETVTAIVVDPRVPSLHDVDPGLPEPLDAIVRRSLAKEPDGRLDSAGQMVQLLERFLVERGEVVRAAQLVQYVRRLFPERADQAPKLNQNVSLMPTAIAAPRPAEREPTGADLALDRAQQYLLASDLDDEERAMAAAAARKRWGVALFFAVVLVGGLGLLGYGLKYGGQPQGPAPAGESTSGPTPQ